MKTTLILSAAATLLAISAGANAAVNTVDVPHITNGGTGYIGLTASAGQPRAAESRATRTMGASGERSVGTGWQGSGGDPRFGMGTPK